MTAIQSSSLAQNLNASLLVISERQDLFIPAYTSSKSDDATIVKSKTDTTKTTPQYQKEHSSEYRSEGEHFAPQSESLRIIDPKTGETIFSAMTRSGNAVMSSDLIDALAAELEKRAKGQ